MQAAGANAEYQKYSGIGHGYGYGGIKFIKEFFHVC